MTNDTDAASGGRPNGLHQAGSASADDDATEMDRASMVAFDRMIAEVGVASLIVAASSRMGQALRRLHDPADVVQETILVALRSWARFDDGGLRARRAWLLTILDHRLQDLARHASRMKRGGGVPPRPLDPSGDVLGLSGAAPLDSTSPSSMARQSELARAIEASLEAMEEPDRSLLLMTVYDVVSVREAARRLELSESTARNRVHHALARLRRELKGHGPGTRS